MIQLKIQVLMFEVRNISITRGYPTIRDAANFSHRIFSFKTEQYFDNIGVSDNRNYVI